MKLRPVGGGYSFSDLYPGEGEILLDSTLLRTRENGQPPIVLEEKVLRVYYGKPYGTLNEMMFYSVKW